MIRYKCIKTPANQMISILFTVHVIILVITLHNECSRAIPQPIDTLLSECVLYQKL